MVYRKWKVCGPHKNKEATRTVDLLSAEVATLGPAKKNDNMNLEHELIPTVNYDG